MLTVQQERHKNGEKHLSKTDADTYCNHVLKSEFLFLKEVDKFALTNAIYHLDNGYNRFLSILEAFLNIRVSIKVKSLTQQIFILK